MAKTQLYLQYYLFSIESMYQWFHINFCWQKCIIHESDVTLASRRLKLPVLRLCGNKIFRTRWNKNKATHYWPFLEGNPPVTGGFPGCPSLCGKHFHIMTSSCSDSCVLCDYDLDVVEAHQSFTPGAFPFIMTTDVAICMRKVLIYRTIFLKPLIQS